MCLTVTLWSILSCPVDLITTLTEQAEQDELAGAKHSCLLLVALMLWLSLVSMNLTAVVAM